MFKDNPNRKGIVQTTMECTLMVYRPNGIYPHGLRPQWNIPSWVIAQTEQVWFNERLFFEVVIVMVKVKKHYTIINDTTSIKISFIVQMKLTIVMLILVFKKFKVAYIFLLLFLCHYQFVKGHFYQKSGRLLLFLKQPLRGVVENDVLKF